MRVGTWEVGVIGGGVEMEQQAASAAQGKRIIYLYEKLYAWQAGEGNTAQNSQNTRAKF